MQPIEILRSLVHSSSSFFFCIVRLWYHDETIPTVRVACTVTEIQDCLSKIKDVAFDFGLQYPQAKFSNKEDYNYSYNV